MLQQKGRSPRLEEMFNGSEFLDLTVLDYDPDLVRSNRAHNVKTIVNAFENLGSTSEVHNWKEILNDLASFVLLDALVGNTDRHHDNWMLLYSVDAGNIRMRAAPSYDHASSLGRELTDERREQIISANRMLNYVKRGRGGVFIDAAGIRAPSPLRLAQLLGRWRSEIAADWMERLVSVPISAILSVIDRIPAEFAPERAREFAYQVIVTSKQELLRSIR